LQHFSARDAPHPLHCLSSRISRTTIARATKAQKTPPPDISLVINIYFIFCRTNSVRGLILYMVNYGRVGKCIMRKSKRYAKQNSSSKHCGRNFATAFTEAWARDDTKKKKRDNLYLAHSARVCLSDFKNESKTTKAASIPHSLFWWRRRPSFLAFAAFLRCLLRWLFHPCGREPWTNSFTNANSCGNAFESSCLAALHRRRLPSNRMPAQIDTTTAAAIASPKRCQKTRGKPTSPLRMRAAASDAAAGSFSISILPKKKNQKKKTTRREGGATLTFLSLSCFFPVGVGFFLSAAAEGGGAKTRPNPPPAAFFLLPPSLSQHFGERRERFVNAADWVNAHP
jgi:hypothetical protein